MLDIKNLYKSYPSEGGALEVLNDFSFHVERGEFVAIMGRSGCGKTTLLNIMGLIDTFDSGTYTLDGQDVTNLSKSEQAKLRGWKIGFVFQSYNLLQELDCRDNVTVPMGYSGVPKKQRDARALELLEVIGLSEKARKYPSQLSGGQQQRIAIARALSNRPQLILADEPTGNLDYQNGVEIMELLGKLNADGTTVIMVTHDEEFSRYARRVVRMKDGVLIA